MFWADQKNLVKGFRQTLDCYCVSCELLSASIADALLFVNILVSGIFHGCFAQRLAVNKPCLQIIGCLLWKQTTTHSLRNKNPMFDGNLWPNSFDQPSTQKYVEIYGMAFLDLENYNIKQRVRHLILTWMIWGTIEKKMTIKKELLNNI